MHPNHDILPLLYRSEAFAEDMAEDETPPPWSLAQGGAAMLLCVLPVGMALLGGAASLWGFAA